MVIDHITHEFQRKGNAAKLVTRTSGSSIQAIETKITLRELEELAAELTQDAKVWRQAQRPDYYAILGLSRDATAKQIREAYRRLSRKFHPDVSPDTGAAMRELNQAYAVLGDQQRRQEYETTLT